MKEFKLRYTQLRLGNYLLQWPKHPVSGSLNSFKLSPTLKELPKANLLIDEAEVSSPVCYAGKERFRPGFE